MNLQLDHVFILVNPEASEADLLRSLGLHEGTRNTHPGQGTANRRFFFNNCMLELLYVHDAQEAYHGPGRELRFPDRTQSQDASPFGIMLRDEDQDETRRPFEGWTYQPIYLEPSMGFHVGANSINLLEPLCLLSPFTKSAPGSSAAKPEVFHSISKVEIFTTASPLSDILEVANSVDRLYVRSSREHRMEITFDDHKSSSSRDLRPDLPLVFHW